MICYICKTQMHQYKKIGGGKSSPDGKSYNTWEIKRCPKCGLLVKEYYEAEVIDDYQKEQLIREYGGEDGF